LDQIISLEQAVAEIKSAHFACSSEEQHRTCAVRRFFYIIGAGVSHPPIPLACGIVARCRDRISKCDPHRADTLAQKLADQPPSECYETYFREAYPSPFQRADFLRSLIDHTKVSHANLRLAHLLSAPAETLISELVVTTNFDELLFKSLRLFGKEPQTFSHPAEFYRIPLYQDEPVVVHLHGKVHNYDVANLTFEQARTAHALGVQSFLGHLLAERSPLVVGYSGWEGDAFMANLRIRLESDAGLKANLYWFCYSEGDYEQLPEWLRHCKQAFFVVPGHDRDPAVTEKHDPQPMARLGAPGFEYDSTDTASLPATQVFEEFIRLFNIDPPPFTSSPLRSTAERLRNILPDNASPENDSIRFEARNYFIQRIWRVVEQLAQDEDKSANSEVLSVLDKVRRSHFGDALDTGVRLWDGGSDEAASTRERAYDLYDLQDAMWTATVGLDSTEGEVQTSKELKGHDVVAEICDCLLKTGLNYFRSEELEYLENRYARSVLYKGIKLAYRMGDLKNAYQAFNGALRNLKRDQEDTAPTMGLRLWRAADLLWIACKDTSLLTTGTGDREMPVDKLVEETRQLLERTRQLLEKARCNKIGKSAELEYAYVQTAFNLACLEKKLDRPGFATSVQCVLAIEHPEHLASVPIVEQAKQWLKDPLVAKAMQGEPKGSGRGA
jgi:hypothetical protein